MQHHQATETRHHTGSVLLGLKRVYSGRGAPKSESPGPILLLGPWEKGAFWVMSTRITYVVGREGEMGGQSADAVGEVFACAREIALELGEQSAEELVDESGSQDHDDGYVGDERDAAHG